MITHGESPDLFIDGLRRTALARRLGMVQAKCLEAIDVAVAQAKEEIREIDIYDFDQVLIRSSNVEGVWEADTFLRLFNASVRVAAQTAIRTSADLRSAILDVRRGFPKPVDEAMPRSAWRLHRREIYEDPAFVNAHCLPISNGDLFTVGSGGSAKTFVLVAQPCDLMVRPDGYRGESDTSDLARMGFWIELPKPRKPLSRETAGKSSEEVQQLVDKLAEQVEQAERRDGSPFELRYFDEATRESRFLVVSRLHSVWLAALDMCALSPSGDAQLDLNADAKPDELLLPAWVEREKRLRALFGRLLGLIPDGLTDVQRAALTAALLPAACRSKSVPIKLVEIDGKRRVTYGMKRTGRLTADRSAALLGRVAAQLARPAFGHDLTRTR